MLPAIYTLFIYLDAAADDDSDSDNDDVGCSDVKSSRPKCDLEAKILASASASISLSYYVIGHFWAKIMKNLGILLIFPAIILNRMLLMIIWYFFVIIFGLGLGLNLQKLASAS